MLQLLFTCRYDAKTTPSGIKRLQKSVWRKCMEKDFGGFFVQRDDYLIGLFEGQEKDVIAQVESLIRKKSISTVHVVREVALDAREWIAWNDDLLELNQKLGMQDDEMAALAQIVDIAVDARRDGFSSAG